MGRHPADLRRYRYEHRNLDPEQIERHIQRDTSAIVATHVFGNPCDVERIEQIARKHNLKVVYDGAHAFGVLHKGRSVYNWGDISTLSFHATKLFHTIEGGAIVTNDDELAARVRLLCNFGIVATDQIDGIGINAKLNEFSAAMGMCVLDDIEMILECRAEIGQRYERRPGEHFELQRPQPDSRCNYSYFPLRWPTSPSCAAAASSMRMASIRGATSIRPRHAGAPAAAGSADPITGAEPQGAVPADLSRPAAQGAGEGRADADPESIHSTESSRTLFQPFAAAFGLLGADQMATAEYKHIS